MKAFKKGSRILVVNLYLGIGLDQITPNNYKQIIVNDIILGNNVNWGEKTINNQYNYSIPSSNLSNKTAVRRNRERKGIIPEAYNSGKKIK